MCEVLTLSHLPALSEALRSYFLKDYKGGGVFQNEEYDHHADDWCWIHKGSGIKVPFWCLVFRYLEYGEWLIQIRVSVVSVVPKQLQNESKRFKHP